MSIFDPEHGYASTTNEPTTVTAKDLLESYEKVKDLMSLPTMVIVAHPDALYDGEMTLQQAMDKGLISSEYVILNKCIGKDEAYEIDKTFLDYSLPVLPPVLPTMKELLEAVEKEGLQVEDIAKGYC